MKSGRHIFFDFLLNFIVNSYFLSVNYFFNSLAVSIFTGNLSGNLYRLKVILLFYCKSDHALNDLLYFFSSGFSCNDLAVVDKSCSKASEHSLSLIRCSTKFSVTCHDYSPPFVEQPSTLLWSYWTAAYFP